MAAQFIGTCVTLRAHELDRFDDSSREITYRTFRKYIDKETIQSFGSNPSLRQDWHVSFFKGRWRGRPAVCLMHSSIHHIWTIA